MAVKVPVPITRGVSEQLVAGRVAVHEAPAPSLIVTVPVGVPLRLGGFTVMLKDTTTAWPMTEGLGATKVIAVVVLALATVIVSTRVIRFWGELESVTCAVKVDVPAANGVPVTAPVLVLSANPAGRLPSGIAHV